MTEKAAKLKALGMSMDESFLNLNELTSKCIQAEVRLRQEGHNLALAVTLGVTKKKGKFRKGKKFPPKKSGSRKVARVMMENSRSFKYLWIDSGATTHVTNLMQGFLTTRKLKEGEKFLYMGNRLKVKVEKYFITFIDDLSRYGYVYLMHEKSQAIDIFEMFIIEVERQLDKKIKIVRSNRGDEYYGKYDESGQNPSPFAKFLEKRGIHAHYTMPSTPQQNDVAERRNHTLMEMVRSMMSYSLVPISLWGEALKTTIFYCPNHSVRIVETHNARFLENGEISGSNEPRKVDIEEIRVDISPPFLPQEIIAPQPVQQVEEHEQHNRDGSLPPENIAIENIESDFDIGIRKNPVSFSQAMESDDSSKWMEAMNDELKSMAHNGVCFTQKEGIDYRDTFSLVSKKDSLKIIMTLVAHFDLELHQMDVKTTFLNGNLDEDIYMEQPEGFAKKGNEHLVCKLKKSIYGLKQASRQCDLALLRETKEHLSKNFKMVDMGEANYVIGIEIFRNRSRGVLGLSQKGYIDRVLERFNMQSCSSGVAPILKGDKLSKKQCLRNNMEKEQMKKIPYASAMGSLRYAQTCTRPDISFDVGMLGRYQSDPGLKHWKAAKKVMRYLQGTKDYMLTYKRSEQLEIVGYLDSDYGGCLDSLKSTSGFVFMLANGAISWKSEK
ncbi:Retrovirus-related Pol polyprotein from transposon TNT 1-94 [Vitis vinifera]|uniref:Retrovirus-related Pol polyprotein from transposon TNT 1-94 n=1 Tax=Vitis vinifera TaxID=29760 RepID=A0A438ERK6_VITVI|nr:Retrovirus-related Pol polyprotein from transposon TNT 1-94 [Vitis vinifera]